MKFIFIVMVALRWGDGQVLLLEDVERQFQTVEECSAHIRAREEGRPANVVAFVCGESIRNRAQTTGRADPSFCFDAIGPEDMDMEANRRALRDCMEGRQ